MVLQKIHSSQTIGHKLNPQESQLVPIITINLVMTLQHKLKPSAIMLVLFKTFHQFLILKSMADLMPEHYNKVLQLGLIMYKINLELHQ